MSIVVLQPDAGHDILQHAPLGRVIEHIVRGDRRHTRVAAALAIAFMMRRVVRTEAPGQRAIGAVAEDRL